MLYSDSETAWLDRRAAKIAEGRDWPLPIARSEAEAELVRMQSRKSAVVLRFPPQFRAIRGPLSIADLPAVPILPDRICLAGICQ